MSAFTDRIYAEMLIRNGGTGLPPRIQVRSNATRNQYAAWRALTSGGMGDSPMQRSGTVPPTLTVIDATVVTRSEK